MIGHHAPNKASELSRCRSDGQRFRLMRGDGTELSFQTFIAFIGVSDDLGIIALLSFHKRGGGFSRQGAGVALSRLGEQPSNVRIALLRDPQAVDMGAAGVFARHQSQIRGEAIRVWEAVEVRHLGDRGQSDVGLDAAEAGKL